VISEYTNLKNGWWWGGKNSAVSEFMNAILFSTANNYKPTA
jgi:hypothetical protein